MKLIVGIDIGNATTESTLAEVDGEDIKVLGSSIEKTTGIKGTKENIKEFINLYINYLKKQERI